MNTKICITGFVMSFISMSSDVDVQRVIRGFMVRPPRGNTPISILSTWVSLRCIAGDDGSFIYDIEFREEDSALFRLRDQFAETFGREPRLCSLGTQHCEFDKTVLTIVGRAIGMTKSGDNVRLSDVYTQLRTKSSRASDLRRAETNTGVGVMKCVSSAVVSSAASSLDGFTSIMTDPEDVIFSGATLARLRSALKRANAAFNHACKKGGQMTMIIGFAEEEGPTLETPSPTILSSANLAGDSVEDGVVEKEEEEVFVPRGRTSKRGHSFRG